MKLDSLPPTPELNKMSAVKDQSQIIGAFLEQLGYKGIHLAQYGDDDQLWPLNQSIEQTLANYFEIDLKKVEKERRAVLDHTRSKS